MNKKSGFEKVANLTGETRTELKTYWTELYGAEYAEAMIKDYKPEGKSKKVEAKSKKTVK